MNDKHEEPKNPATQETLHPAPKVLNFSPQKTSSSSLFHKKSFLVGLFLTVVLAIGALVTGFFLIRERITTPPKADNPFACYIQLKPNPNKIVAGEKKNPNALIEGQKGDTTIKWKVTTEDGKEKGTFSSKNTNPTEWTAPDNLDNLQSWTFTATVTDSGGTTITCTRTITNDKSKQEPVKVTNTVATNERGSEAKLQVSVKNLTDQPVTIELAKDRIWCKIVPPAGNFGSAVTTCTSRDGGVSVATPSESFTLGPNETKEVAILTQKVGNTGTCGAAQVDIWTTANGERLANGNSAVAFLDPCVTKYSTCDANNACTEKTCAAGETCTSTCDPTKTNPCGSKFYECVGEACTQSSCPPGQSCSNKCNISDPNACKTATKYHVCNSQKACEEKTCPAGSTCTSTCDPSEANPCGSTYSQCSGEACVTVNCPVGSTCTSTCDASNVNSCKTFKHNVCQNSACVQVNCPTTGVSCATAGDCKSNADCVTAQTFQHNVCINQSCTRVDCSPNTQSCGDECTSSSDCGKTVAVAQTHKECQNQACVVVSGAGADLCTSDVSCRPAATPPPIPQSGSTALTIGAIVLGLGVLAVGLLFAL